MPTRNTELGTWNPTHRTRGASATPRHMNHWDVSIAIRHPVHRTQILELDPLEQVAHASDIRNTKAPIVELYIRNKETIMSERETAQVPETGDIRDTVRVPEAVIRETRRGAAGRPALRLPYPRGYTSCSRLDHCTNLRLYHSFIIITSVNIYWIYIFHNSLIS